MKCYYQMQIKIQNLKNNKKLTQKKIEINFYKKPEFFQLDQIKSNFYNIIRVNKENPYFMNISDDPSLTGCLVYYLKSGENKFGASKDCDFIINGLGIRK